MKGKDELEGTRSNFTPWLRDFEHKGENCLVGCCNTPFGKQGLRDKCLADILHKKLLSKNKKK